MIFTSIAWAFVKSNWKLFAIGAAVLAVFSYHKIQVSRAFKDGRQAERAAAIALAAKRIKERDQNDAEFRKLPARDRCIAFMRDSGLPVGNNCD